MMPSIDFPTAAAVLAIYPGGTVGGGVGAISAARFSGSPSSCGKIGDPDVCFRQARIQFFKNLRPEVAIVHRSDERSGDVVQRSDLLFKFIELRFCRVHGVVLLPHYLRSLLRDLGRS